MAAILEISGLSVVRGATTILHDVNWRVARGEHWAVLGANGSGKTSLLKALTGYLSPTSGALALLGRNYGEADWRELRLHVGLVMSALQASIPPAEPAWETVVSGRYAQLEPVVRRVFDIPFMTQLAVGPEWAALNETQRRQVTQAFERYIAAIYAERFDSYSGERLQVTGERQSPGGTIITSQIVKSNGEPVNINYLVRDTAGGWRIADVYLDGTISELATRRSEFASILRAGGINGLIQTLNTKADALSSAS